jgi:hypothetical protein
MRTGVVVLMLLAEALAFGQGFNRRYDAFGWGNAQTAFGIERHAAGYVVTSGSYDTDSLGPDLWLTHVSVILTYLDMNGVKLSEKRTYRPYHGTYPGWANCCDTVPGGGYVVGGTSEDTTGFDEVYLMRFDADGDTLWAKAFGDPNGALFWIGQQVKHTPDGGFVVSGFTEQGGWDGFALKTDSAGNEMWRRTYGWSAMHSDGLASVESALNGDLFMSGSRFLSDGTGDNWVQRTDAAGDVIWSVSFGGPYSEGSCNISRTMDGDLLVFSGQGYGPSYSLMRPYMARINGTDGSILWEREFGP